MVGSGIFLLPATLALYGSISLIGWIFASIGAILLAIVFGNLGKVAPNITGGPYAYTKLGLGIFPGYLVAWGYWVSIWCTNAAIAVALVGYLEVFFPFLNDTTYAIVTGLAVIWLFTWINSKPLKTVAIVQIVTTVLKVTPIFLIAIFGYFYIESGNFKVPNLSGESDFSSITITTTATLFAFLGMESATITSSKIENAQKTIRNSTIAGTFFTIVIYITSSVVIMGIIPQGDLVNSNAPFADAAALFWGDLAKYIVAGGAVIATLGALNGWILIQGQVPMAAANDNLFPKLFGQTNKNDSPIIGIILSSSLASLVMGLNFSDGLVQAFTFMMNLSTLSVLTPYLLSSISLIVLLKSSQSNHLKEKIISYLAIIFCVWVIFGSGIKVVLWGFFLLILGIPLYFLLNNEKNQNTE